MPQLPATISKLILGALLLREVRAHSDDQGHGDDHGEDSEFDGATFLLTLFVVVAGLFAMVFSASLCIRAWQVDQPSLEQRALEANDQAPITEHAAVRSPCQDLGDDDKEAELGWIKKQQSGSYDEEAP